MRIGGRLIAEGLIDAARLDAALRIQEQYGGRIGSTLVELGALDVDALARVLGKHLGVPAAVQKHFDRMESAVVARFPKKVAERHGVVPLGWSTKHAKTLIVAMIDPTNYTAIDEIAFAVSARIQPSVAPEIRIAHLLERHFGVAGRGRSFVRMDANLPAAPPSSNPPPPRSAPLRPHVASTPGVPRLDLDLPPPPPSRQEEPPIASSPRSTPLSLTLPPAMEPAAHEEEEETAPARIGVADTIAALEAADSRDAIGDAVVRFLRGAFAIGLVLIAKNGMALGWKGFAREVGADVIEGVALPLQAPSMFRAAFEGASVFRGAPPADGGALQQRFFKLLRASAPREVVVAPIVVRGSEERVVNLVYAHPRDGGALPPGAATEIAAVCAAAGEAYGRILRSKARRGDEARD